MPPQTPVQQPHQGPVHLDSSAASRKPSERRSDRNHATAGSPESVDRTEYGQFQSGGAPSAPSKSKGSSVGSSATARPQNPANARQQRHARKHAAASSTGTNSGVNPGGYTWISHSSDCDCGRCLSYSSGQSMMTGQIQRSTQS